MKRTLATHANWHDTQAQASGNRLARAGLEEQPRALHLGWEHTSSATRSPHWMRRSSTS